MKQKVLNVIKPLLASKGLSKEELESLAEIAAKNLNAESTDEDIKNVANGLVPYAEVMQKMGNRMATAVENKYKGWVDPATIQKPEPPTPPVPPATPATPAMTKEEIQKMISEGIARGVEEKMKPYQQREEQTRLRTLLYQNDKVKSIPDSFRSRYSVDKEENLETVAAQIESDFAQMKADLLKSGVFAEPPAGGNGNTTDEMIDMLKQMGDRATKK